MAHTKPGRDLPDGLSSPARRARQSAGIERLDQLVLLTEREVMQLRGMCLEALAMLRSALAMLRSALADRGLAFCARP